MLAGIVTLLWMLAFIAVWAWAWRPSLRAGFDAAARLAVEDAPPAATVAPSTWFFSSQGNAGMLDSGTTARGSTRWIRCQSSE